MNTCSCLYHQSTPTERREIIDAAIEATNAQVRAGELADDYDELLDAMTDGVAGRVERERADENACVSPISVQAIRTALLLPPLPPQRSPVPGATTHAPQACLHSGRGSSE